jgi:chitinase
MHIAQSCVQFMPNHEELEMSDIPQDQSMRLVGYFPAGAIHAQNYHVPEIPAGLLTHVIYAFANVTAAGDCVSVNAKDDAVNFSQLLDLKANNPGLLVLISVGGASHSTNFAAVSATAATRAQLPQSCVQFMTQNGFDGIDIDWEFRGAQESESEHFTALLQELGSQLAPQGDGDGRDYLLTIAAPEGPQNIVNLQLAQIHPDLDWINLMTYDFSTASSHKTNFAAPLFTHESALNVNAAVNTYLGAGVPADKIVLGVRFVGAGWQGVGPTNNGLYQADTGPRAGDLGSAGAAPSGSFCYQDIENNYLQLYAPLGRGGAGPLAL